MERPLGSQNAHVLARAWCLVYKVPYQAPLLYRLLIGLMWHAEYQLLQVGTKKLKNLNFLYHFLLLFSKGGFAHATLTSEYIFFWSGQEKSPTLGVKPNRPSPILVGSHYCF